MYLCIFVSVIYLHLFLPGSLKRESSDSVDSYDTIGNYSIVVPNTYCLLTQVTEVKCKTSYPGSGYLYFCVYRDLRRFSYREVYVLSFFLLWK